MGKKILVVLTSVDKMEGTDHATGWYLPELAHPYKVLVDAGFTDFTVISPKGGKAPVDPGSVEESKNDAICQWFQADAKAQALVSHTKTVNDVKDSWGDFSAVLFPGGHGPMFDLAREKQIGDLVAKIYDNGGLVAAVCHGPAGLIPVTLSNGDSIVKGKQVTSFTNDEEAAVKLTDCMPFPLETRLIELEAKYSKKPNFQAHVLVDGRLITGQNPASSTPLGNEMVKLLKC